MSFTEYFKPSKRNLSLTGVILLSQLSIFLVTTALTVVVSPEWTSEPVDPQPVVDTILFSGLLLGNYVAACSADWWINEYLEE